ncbi:hypothetical protein [Anaerotignum sp. MSJ-24]|uniref:hypothetical protein n=1 Tax=Anaerotignum sp. MSJ-24 TaxID=2841521 RepID=UPI001C1229A3|nr:hypothetical protein [Anaerotignum sp. MSJ-24]
MVKSTKFFLSTLRVKGRNGKEALHLLNKHTRKFSAILLDLIMPVMDVEHKL